MAISGKVAEVYVQTTAVPLAFSNEAMIRDGNMLTKNQSDVEIDTTGFEAINSATLARNIVEFWQGLASLRVITPGTVTAEGVTTAAVAATPSKIYTASVWLKGSGTVKLILRERTAADAAVGETSSASITLTNTWQRVAVSRTFGATGERARIAIETASQQAVTFYVDGLQLEQSAAATAWKEGTHNKRWRIADASKRYWNEEAPVTISKNGTPQSSGFRIEYAGGIVVFDTDLADSDTVTASGEYLTVAAGGGLLSWSLDLSADELDTTSFDDGGWKSYMAPLKGFTGSAEGFWGDTIFWEHLNSGNTVVVIFYVEGPGIGAQTRFEGYATISAVNPSGPVDGVVGETVNFQGTGTLYLREG